MNKENKELYFTAKIAYYKGEPIMEDAEFDTLEAKLAIEFPNIAEENIGSCITTLDAHKHYTHMASLNKFNIYENENDQEVMENIEKWLLTYGKQYIIYPKYDGNGINITYEVTNGIGKLQSVVSRGDGIEGRTQTDKFKHILPEKLITIPQNSHIIEFRAEALMGLDVFDAKYAKDFQNPRNLVGGILNKKDFDINKTNDLLYEIYDVYVDGKIYTEKLIDHNNLRTKNSYTRHIMPGTISAFKEMYEELKAYKATCNYYLDGIVIKVLEDERTFYPNGNPKDCVAIKFPPTETTTVIENIIWEVGKEGELTPVMHVKPTLLDGTTVKRASAHNYKYVVDNEFYPTALVTISKSGDIIPQLRKVIKPAHTKYNFPTVCPSCESVLELGETHLKCLNKKCPTQQKGKLGGIVLFDVEFFGGSTIEKLFDAGITTVEDFFTDKFTEQYLTKHGFKSGRSLSKILDQIHNMKEVKLSSVIHALQFKNVGKSISAEYAKKLAGIDYTFESMDRNAISQISDTRITAFVELIETCGIKVIIPEVKEKTNLPTFEMTGSVNANGANTKKEFEQLINAEHVKLNKDCMYLITDDLSSTSSKMKKAEKLGVKIITYSDALELLK